MGYLSAMMQMAHGDEHQEEQLIEIVKGMDGHLLYMVARTRWLHIPSLVKSFVVSRDIDPDWFHMISIPGKVLIGTNLYKTIKEQIPEVEDAIKEYQAEERD